MTKFGIVGNRVHVMPLNELINVFERLPRAIRREIFRRVSVGSAFRPGWALRQRAGMTRRGQKQARPGRRGGGLGGMIQIMPDGLCRPEMSARRKGSYGENADDKGAGQAGRVQFQLAFPFLDKNFQR